MSVKAVLLLLELVLVSCQPGPGSGDGNDADEAFKLSIRAVPGLGPDSLLLPVSKRQGYGYTDFDGNEVEAIVERHNFHRSNTKPSASNMKHMTWDNDLATMSQRWADACVYEHGGQDGAANISPFQPKVGQNLAIGTGLDFSSGVIVTDAWHSEDEFYTYNSNTCRPGEQCGHYTQVVWADSYKVGCGRKLCSQVIVNGQRWTDAYYIVCDYGPGGNYKGEKPFKTGDRCSACPNDAAFCADNSLCRDCTEVSNTATCGECNRICENCGTLDAASCTCSCAPGWSGVTCSEKCADHHEWCGANPGWYGPELCNDWTYSDDVRKYCLKMCGICQGDDPSFVCGENGGGGGGGGGDGDGGGGGGGCTDSNAGCAAWADSGECDANPVWMLTNCQLSCKVCEPAIKNTKYCKTSFTATSVIDGDLLVFKKDKYWRFDDIKNGNLQTSAGGDLVRDAFPKVNPDVRGVYQRPDNKVVIFRGGKYWLYTRSGNGWARDNGFPKDISQTFPGLPTPSAAVYDSIEGKTYIFSGPRFWRYDERQQRFDLERQPISSMFNGVPSKISGAFIDENSDFILVKGRDFWRIRRGQRNVSSPESKNLSLEYLDCYE